MKISLNLLKTFINIPDETKLADILTMIGHEVESVKHFKSDKFVIGVIEKLEKHPNADRLTVCKVNIGSETLTIVCGAKNHKEKDKVVVALEGAIVKGIEIKKTELKSVISEGMLCSEFELDLSKSSEGILILDESATVGEQFNKYYFNNDTVYDLSITPNRPDVLSHLGVAKELAAYYKSKIRKLDELANKNMDSKQQITDCKLFRVFEIDGVTVKESPAWLKSYLTLLGMKSINNLVDISNLVMFELGHPSHFFDAKAINGNLSVRYATNNEKIKGLDEVEYNLNDSDIVVTDEKKAVAIAGIMGSLETGIKHDTKRVFLEIALFDKNRVRKTSKRLNLSTEASYRFERGLDLEDSSTVLARILNMLQEISGYSSVNEIYRYKADFEPNKILVDVDKLNSFLGTNISFDTVLNILANLHLNPKLKDHSIEVTAPSYRLDLSREVDIYEEVLRIYGFDKVSPELPYVQSKVSKDKPEDIRSTLLSLGLNEVINYSFVPKEYGTLKINNPINEDFAVMRDALTYSLIKNITYNINNGVKEVNIFETGKIYFPEEKERLGIALSGTKEKTLYSNERDLDFSDLKGILEQLNNKFNWDLKLERAIVESLHPKRSVKIFHKGVEVGFFGEISPILSQKFNLKNRAYILEMDMLKPSPYTIEDISKYPSVSRELALLFQKDLDMGKVIQDICNLNLVIQHEIVDIYENKDIMADKKSVAFKFVIQSKEKTLTDTEIDNIVSQIINNAKKYGGKLRDF